MSKRRPIRSNLNNGSHMNFRHIGPDTGRSEARGTRPTASPSTIREIIIMMVMHVCKKTIFFDTKLKAALYLGSLFVISLIGDFIPFPKTYLARSDNVLNVFFVKIGWGWTLILTVPFIIMTSYTLCCGDKNQMLKQHIPRIAVATFFWLFWTKIFNAIESTYGKCTIKGFATKSTCLKAGYLWNGFDISGHSFILIYSSFVLIEEARPIIKWESIKEYLRNEIHDRSTSESGTTNPLRNLSSEQIRNLTLLYNRLTPIIRTLFIGMAMLQLIWDIMLVSTMLYYHRMVEKFMGGVFAILTWYFTYGFWYPSPMPPELPGSGQFVYQYDKRSYSNTLKRQQNVTSTTNTPSSSTGQYLISNSTPTFMGMPLHISSRATSNVFQYSTKKNANEEVY